MFIESPREALAVRHGDKHRFCGWVDDLHPLPTNAICRYEILTCLLRDRDEIISTLDSMRHIAFTKLNIRRKVESRKETVRKIVYGHDKPCRSDIGAREGCCVNDVDGVLFCLRVAIGKSGK